MDARNIAQNFSASLTDTFAIENNPRLEGLLQSVEEKYAPSLIMLLIKSIVTNCSSVHY